MDKALTSRLEVVDCISKTYACLTPGQNQPDATSILSCDFDRLVGTIPIGGEDPDIVRVSVKLVTVAPQLPI
jgi:hypothetical protein